MRLQYQRRQRSSETQSPELRDDEQQQMTQQTQRLLSRDQREQGVMDCWHWKLHWLLQLRLLPSSLLWSASSWEWRMLRWVLEVMRRLWRMQRMFVVMEQVCDGWRL